VATGGWGALAAVGAVVSGLDGTAVAPA